MAAFAARFSGETELQDSGLSSSGLKPPFLFQAFAASPSKMQGSPLEVTFSLSFDSVGISVNNLATSSREAVVEDDGGAEGAGVGGSTWSLNSAAGGGGGAGPSEDDDEVVTCGDDDADCPPISATGCAGNGTASLDDDG